MGDLPAVIDGKYQIVRQLGEGGMGAVYEAKHLGTNRRVAVKVISGDALQKGAGVIDRFQREARATGAIESQHIAMVLDTGTDAATGNPYLVMEYLSGEDLAALLGRVGALAPDAALRIAAQACAGLAKAHDAGVIHRDIKPANVFLTQRDGDVVVKLLDFGIAKIRVDVTSSENRELTKTGAVLGSPLYMSPEQALGYKTIDHRTDLWSLGVVLYEALTGRTPHGDVDTVGGLIVAICSKPAPHIQDVAPWIDGRVAGIVHKALALDPAERFQTAAELLDALQACLPSGTALREQDLVAMSAAGREKVEEKIPLALAQTAPLVPASSRDSLPLAARTTGGLSQPEVIAPRSNPWVRFAPAGILVAAVAGSAIWLAARNHSQTAPPPPTAAPSAASAVPSASAAPAAKSVGLVVPPGAEVQIDGAPVSNANGVVMLSGAVGSTHHVHVTLDSREANDEVAITQTGALPSTIELAPAPSARPKPRPSATTTSKAVGAPTFERKFQ